MPSFKNTNINLIKRVMREYENRMDVRIDNSSRLHEQVEHRCAIANAVRCYTSLKNIGALFGKDHSSIVHYNKEHLPMIRFYPSYRKKFHMALQVTNELAREMRALPIMNAKEGINAYQQLVVIDQTTYELNNLKQYLEKIVASYEQPS